MAIGLRLPDGTKIERKFNGDDLTKVCNNYLCGHETRDLYIKKLG